MSKIKITLNGLDHEITKGQTIFDLVDNLQLDLEKIAIEQNLEIIMPDNFKKTLINSGDRIEVVSFIGGG